MAELDAMLERSRLLRHSLSKGQMITDNMIGILSSFDHRLSDLEAAIRPTQVHTNAIRQAHEHINSTLKVAGKILAQFHVSRKLELKIMEGPHEDLRGYLAAVDELYNNVEFFTLNGSFKSSGSALNHVHGLLAKAMARLEEEFKRLLVTQSKSPEPVQLEECIPEFILSTTTSVGEGVKTNGTVVAENTYHERNAYAINLLISPTIVPILHELARRLVTSDHHQQCCKIYKDIRVSVLEKTIHKLGVDRLVREDVQKLEWKLLEGKITNWILAMYKTVKLLFYGERKLADQVLNGLDPYQQSCFADITRNTMTTLLSFGEFIATSRRSPEKLFDLLKMYATMRDLYPEVEYIFGVKPAMDMCNAFSSLTQRLAQAAGETFSDFPGDVEKDNGKTFVSDGNVHQLTTYVARYINSLFMYQTTLGQIFGEDETVKRTDSQLAATTVKAISALQANLEGKSKLYRDPALSHIFLMNNIHFMVKSLQQSEAKDFLGEDWIQRHRRIVQQHAQNYRRVAWSKVLDSLKTQALTSSGSSGFGNDGSTSTGVARKLVKERFKSFNAQFDELYQRHLVWCVPDTELREYVRLSVAEVVLSAYRSFLKRIGPILEGGKNPSKYVKYSPEQLEVMIGDFFERKTRNESQNKLL